MFERYPEYEYLLASVQLAFAMLGMGAASSLADYVRVFRVPHALLIGLATQLVSVPCMAVATAWLLGLEAGLAVGLVLVSAVPGGTMSNVATWLAGGNTTLSISLTAVSTGACLVTTPLVLRVFAGGHLPGAVVMPVGRIVFDIALCLLLPLAVGMALGAVMPPARRAWFTRRSIQASLVVIGVMVVGATASGRVDAGAYGWRAVGALLLFALLVQRAAVWASRLGGLVAADALAIGIEATIRNTNLALLLKASLFPAAPGVPDPFADQVLFMALLYGGVALAVAAPPILRHRRRGEEPPWPGRPA